MVNTRSPVAPPADNALRAWEARNRRPNPSASAYVGPSASCWSSVAAADAYALPDDEGIGLEKTEGVTGQTRKRSLIIRFSIRKSISGEPSAIVSKQSGQSTADNSKLLEPAKDDVDNAVAAEAMAPTAEADSDPTRQSQPLRKRGVKIEGADAPVRGSVLGSVGNIGSNDSDGDALPESSASSSFRSLKRARSRGMSLIPAALLAASGVNRPNKRRTSTWRSVLAMRLGSALVGGGFDNQGARHPSFMQSFRRGTVANPSAALNAVTV